MNKKILSLIIAGAVILSALAGCTSEGNADGEGTTTAVTTTAAEENVTNAPEETDGSGTNAPEETEGEATNAPEDSSENGQETPSEVSAAAIAEVIKAAYGDNYLPDTLMDAEMIELFFGLTADSYADIYAETPMIGAHPDTLLIVKPAEGKYDEVKAVIDGYRENLVNDLMQYPMNLAKIHASQVVTGGDYIAFILLGAINEDDDAPEEEQAKFAEEQEKIGVDAFNNYFA